MNETQKITLSNGEVVEMLTSLTWGQKESIQNIYIKSAKISTSGFDGLGGEAFITAKYKLLEMVIKGISKDGKTKPFAREWINNLSVEDGDLVYNTANKLNEKKVEATAPLN